MRLSCTHMSTTFCLRSRKPPRTICRDGNHIKVTQTRSTMSLECMSIDLAGRTLESPLTNAEITGYRSVLGQLLWLGQQSRPDLCVGVSLAAQRLSKATFSDVKTLNKLVERAKNTAKMGIVLPCGVVNLETCSVACYADAGFANAEREKSQCGLVCCLTHSPELLKTVRFDLSTIISWQSSTIKRVVRSTLAAEGYAVSEGLESAQWFRHLLTEAHMARSSLKNVEKESLKRPAIAFTDNDSLANTVKKDVATTRGSESSCPCSEKDSEKWRIHRLASCRSFDEDDGKGHPRLILQQSCVSTCGQENLCKKNSHRKCLMLPRNEFQLLLTRI